jgi:dTDP-4-dehydrorhamnose 3,5-epimerase
MAKFRMESLALPDVRLIRPTRFGDARGYFLETYSRQAFAEIGITAEFVQDNQSMSGPAGTLRGLHFQKPPFSQAKLVRVLKGAIFDVAVDLRVGSPHFARWCGANLTAEGDEQLYVPKGFAHGFVTLEPETVVAYKVDAPYSAECDAGITYDDPHIDVQWPWPAESLTLSAKDKTLPLLSDIVPPFTYSAP